MFSKKSKLKKVVLTLLTVGTMSVSAGVVAAKTVYYKGTAVEWDYGRTAGAWGYSNVESNQYCHGATVNGLFSGWKKKGHLASARKFIGSDTLEAYWSCKSGNKC